ncbi:hypothetical protein RI367_000761 [Sorochytrium milnesiophthora]
MFPTVARLAGAVMNRARKGLYGGKTIQFGNQISHSEHKTRRTWKPNVHFRALYSHTLERHFRIKITSAALRTIDKKGGLDAYLLTTKDHKINSDVGSKLKGMIKSTLHARRTTSNAPAAHASSQSA